MISQRFERIYEEMTAAERREVEFFAAFVIARRNSRKDVRLLTDDIPMSELLELVARSGSFDWLGEPEEDRYSFEDGEEVQWPQKS